MAYLSLCSIFNRPYYVEQLFQILVLLIQSISKPVLLPESGLVSHV